MHIFRFSRQATRHWLYIDQPNPAERGMTSQIVRKNRRSGLTNPAIQLFFRLAVSAQLQKASITPHRGILFVHRFYAPPVPVKFLGQARQHELLSGEWSVSWS